MDSIQLSTFAEDPVTPPVMLDGITGENPSSSETNTPDDSPESEPEIGSDEDPDSQSSDDESSR